MPVNNGKITAPISVNDISVAIAKASSDVGTLCYAKANINKWARNKPMIYNSPAQMTDSQKQAINFGLTIPGSSTNYVTAASKEYEYNCPVSGNWARMTDFEKYDHTVSAPILWGLGEITFNVALNSQLTIMFPMNIVGGDYAIGLSELPGIGAKYLALVLVDNSSEIVYVKTAATTLADNGDTITLLDTESPFIGSTERTFTYYMLALDVKKDSFDDTVIISYTSLPFPKAADGIGTFNLKKFSGVGLSPIEIGLSAMLMESIDPYIGPYIDPDPSIYWPTNSNGDLYLRFSAYNSSNQAITLYASNMMMSVTPTLVDGSGGSGNMIPTLYNASGTQVSEISVPANGSIDIIIGTTTILNRLNGAIYIQGKYLITANINILYRNSALGMAMGVRIKSYNY